MNVENLLSRSAQHVASQVAPPPVPDPVSLGGQAVSRRRRRRLAAAAVASAAVTAAAAVLVWAPAEQRASEPVDDPPLEPLGDVAAWVDQTGDVHIGERVLDLPNPPERQYAAQQADVWARKFALTETGVVWRDVSLPWPGSFRGPVLHPDSAPSALYWQGLGQPPVELGEDEATFFTADPLGDTVVWVTAERQMVTYDVGERREIDSRKLEDGTELARPPVLYADYEQVVYRSAGAVWRLDLGEGTTTRVGGEAGDDVLDYTPEISVVAVSPVSDGGGARALGQLEFRTATRTVLAEPGRLFREGRLSPDGRWFVTSTGYESGLRTVVLDTATGKRVRLGLPDRARGPYPDPWGWAGHDVLIIELRARDGDEGGYLWACRPFGGSCEPLPDPAAGAYPW
ncbi:hypothetical protein ACFQW6_12950 [Nocardioides sp. GCM10028917]|uniref:hypothetical protein n=1 Tax=Nocardioides sp. GCM10028917 TaxID=3273408 RepID=UPI0036238BC0